MSEPTDNDLDQTQDDGKVERTDNGWRDGDGPQPAQLVTVARGGTDVITNLLNVAASQIGTTEDARGCQKYGAFYGMDCVAWCAEFVWWCFNQANLQGLICKAAYTPTFFQWFVDHHQDPNDIKRGDVVFFDWPDSVHRIQHVGLVEAVNSPDNITTIEGNTTPPTGVGDQGMGGGVWRRNRSMSLVAGWGRPAYPTAAPPAPIPTFDPNSLPTLEYGMRGDAHVANLQKASNAAPWDPELPLLPVTGNYLDQTAAVIARAQAQRGVTGPDANGRIVGPRTKAAFAAFGLRW